MLVLPHAVTSGASLHIEQENKSRVSQSRLDLISILALSLVFHSITLESRKNPHNTHTHTHTLIK